MASITTTSYDEAWTFLDQLQFFKIKLGLDSMNMFMESLEKPHLQFPCIHIGGTNGKGSVGATLLSILTAAGYRVGFYTSPHLSSVRERFRVKDTFIPEKEFAAQAEKIINILEGRQITYFEFTTAMAMLWFAEKKVDLAILEVGMGGRLDATNIVVPLVSIITNVSMDHEQYLGDTISQVAYEKAGIIKHGVPVVTGVAKKRALDVISQTADERTSKVYLAGRDFTGSRDMKNRSLWTYTGMNQSVHGELPLSMKGDYQVDNASLALAALELISSTFPVTADNIRHGLANVRWPGRLEEFWQTRSGKINLHPSADDTAIHFLLDGAHNPDGAEALKKSLENDVAHERLILVWASMADKDIHSTLMRIAPLAETIIFTQPDEERSAPPEKLKELLPKNIAGTALCIKSVRLALDHAREIYTPGSMIRAAGSLYLVGRARQLLCGELVDNL